MAAEILYLEFEDSDFPIEVHDEAAGEVLIFDDADLLAQFEEAEAEGVAFEHPRLRRRVLELRDQLLAITGELDIILGGAAA
ncbi:hypothetical protein ACXR2T_09920 [Leucobacter sp. HY1910]